MTASLPRAVDDVLFPLGEILVLLDDIPAGWRRTRLNLDSREYVGAVEDNGS